MATLPTVRGSLSIGLNETSDSLAITPIPASSAMLLASARGGDNVIESSQSYFSFVVDGSQNITDVVMTRDVASAATTMEGEFTILRADEITVHNFQGFIAGGTANFTIPSSVDLSRSWVIPLGVTRNGGARGGNDVATFEITTSTNVLASSNTDCYVSFQVVEASADIIESVQYFSDTLTAGLLDHDSTISSVDADKSLIFPALYYAGVGTLGSDKLPVSYLTSSTNLRHSVRTSGTDIANITATGYVVEFSHLPVENATEADTTATSFTRAVDHQNSGAIMSGMFNRHSNAASFDDDVRNDLWTATYSEDLWTFERIGTSEATVPTQVFDWNRIFAPDSTPDDFTFTDVTDVEQSVLIESNEITVTGINMAAAISIIGGEYSIDGGAFTSDAGTIDLDQTVVVRVGTSGNYSTDSNCTLTIGGVSDTFTVTTVAAPADTTPDAFTLLDHTGVEPGTSYASNTITVSGINQSSPITISETGEYSVNGGDFTSIVGSVDNGDTVTVRNTSSSGFSTSIDTTLTIGGVSDVFTLTTRASDNTPDPFSFDDVTGADLGEEYISNTIVLTGFTEGAVIAISNGEYSIDGGSYTAAPGIVDPDSFVNIRLTSSAFNSTAVNAQLSVGGVSDTFTITTESIQDTTPNSYTIPEITQAAASAVITSASVQITGIDAPTDVSISEGGEYSINGGAWLTGFTQITNGQQVRVRQTSSDAELTSTAVTLTIGGLDADFVVTTGDLFDAGDLTAIAAELSIFPNFEGGVFVYDGNATEVRLHNVRTDDNEALINMTVEGSIATLAGVDTENDFSLTHDAENTGNYEGDIIPTGLTQFETYLLQVTVSIAGTQLALFTQEFVFKRRGSV